MRELAERKLPEIDALIRRAEAVRRWLEMTRACDCDTLDMCSLFDDRLLQPHDRPTRRVGATIEVTR